ncbi:MAG TPA: hypothetical protein VMY76_04900 [Gemmatimonadales bacterium]|nr:hypothetical protein [Gemmatimonadales bacterium]
MHAVIGRAAALCVVIGLGACGGEDGFSPSIDTVSGSYAAVTFTLTSAVGTTDLLALGSTVVITLSADGTTRGRLFVPGGDDNGGDLDVDLAGTWILNGETVTLSTEGDTFIADADFTAGRDRLSGEESVNGTTIRLVLGKTG